MLIKLRQKMYQEGDCWWLPLIVIGSAIILLLGVATFAEGDDLHLDEESLLSKNKPLTTTGRSALQILKKSRNQDVFVNQDENGGLTYLYGSGVPELICSPLHICLLALQEGESILPNGVHLGDSTRWSATPLLAASMRTEIILKPLDAGLKTNMTVHTTKRTYTVELVSRRDEYMPYLSFRYPSNEGGTNATDTEAWQEYFRTTGGDVLVGGGSGTPAVDIRSEMDFDYEIGACKKCKFVPARVFNDGSQTYIDLADNYKGPLPVFAILNGDQPHTVNSRWDEGRLIVETIFHRGELRIDRNAVSITWRGMSR